MHTRQELIKGYETEIRYQRHMLENLGRWFSVLFLMASIGGHVGSGIWDVSWSSQPTKSCPSLPRKTRSGWLEIENTSKRLGCFFLDYF